VAWGLEPYRLRWEKCMARRLAPITESITNIATCPDIEIIIEG
jgi:hypothetical protein